MFIHMHGCMYEYKYVCMDMDGCNSGNMCLCVCTHGCVEAYVYAYVYICSYVHMHTSRNCRIHFAFKLLRLNGLNNFVTTARLAAMRQASAVVTKLFNASCLSLSSLSASAPQRLQRLSGLSGLLVWRHGGAGLDRGSPARMGPGAGSSEHWYRGAAGVHCGGHGEVFTVLMAQHRQQPYHEQASRDGRRHAELGFEHDLLLGTRWWRPGSWLEDHHPAK